MAVPLNTLSTGYICDYTPEEFIQYGTIFYWEYDRTYRPPVKRSCYALSPDERKRSIGMRKDNKKSINSKLKGFFRILHESLILSSRTLLINVVLKIPTVDEANGILKKVGVRLTPMQEVRLKRLGNSNEIMEVFRHTLESMFKEEDTNRRRAGLRCYSPYLFTNWTREYGIKLGRRHYHMVIGVSGHRELTAGEYHGFPMRNHNFARRIAWCWLTALGLSEFECTLSTGPRGAEQKVDAFEDEEFIDKETGEITNRPHETGRYPKSLFGWLIYYPGKKGGRKVSEGAIYKSCMVYRHVRKTATNWISKVLRYMFKHESKTVPEDKRGNVKEKERTYGCTRKLAY